MSKALIRHLYERNHDAVMRSSYLNCHVWGLHSVMLLDEPGKRIRLYIADATHKLHLNRGYFRSYDPPMSLGFHSHSYDITLEGVLGKLHNIVASAPELDSPFKCILSAYKFDSTLRGGGGSFELLSENVPFGLSSTSVSYGRVVRMPAAQLHTVYVRRGEVAAWLVYEGAEDPHYEPITYANHDLTLFKADGMYGRPTAHDVEDVLRLAGVFS